MLNKRSTETSSLLPLRMSSSESLGSSCDTSVKGVDTTHSRARTSDRSPRYESVEQVIDRSATFEQVLIFMVILHVH